MPAPDPDYAARLIAARCPELNPAIWPIFAADPGTVPVEVLEAVLVLIDALQERIDRIEEARSRRTAAE
jgi:hypothetical protein